MEFLTEDLKGFSIIEPKDIQKGDRIAYYTKAQSWKNGKQNEEKLVKGGFIGTINLEDGFLTMFNPTNKFKWSVQFDNVQYFYKQYKKQQLKK